MVHIIVKDLTASYFGGLFTSACVYNQYFFNYNDGKNLYFYVRLIFSDS